MRTLVSLLFLLAAASATAQYTPPTVVKQNNTYGNFHRPYDWDGDGDLDLLGPKKIGNQSLFLVYENTGGGRLSDPVSVATLPYGYHGCEQLCVPLADLNADGRTDLVAQYNDTVLVYLQGSDGQLLETQRIFSYGTNKPAAEPADMDGDGDLDIGYYNIDGLRWTQNDGTGHFQGEFLIALSPPNFILLFTTYADLNKDGRSDVVFYDFQNGDTLDVYLNEGTQFTRKEVPNLPFAPGDLLTVKIADLDGDGLPDLLPFPLTKSPEYWFKNLGNGDFSASIPLVPAPGADKGAGVALLTADLDADGDTDIVGRMTDTLAWYENDGAGGFSFRYHLFERGLQDLSLNDVRDWDRDGLPDILCTANFSDAGSVAFVRNLGNGQFAPRRYITPDFTQIQAVQAADLDGDGDKDLLIGSYQDMKLAWYPALGNGQWGEQRLVDSLQYNQTFAIAADLDGDGDNDLLNTFDVPDQFLYRNQLFIHENLGGGQFGPAQKPLPGLPMYTEKAWVVDLDTDGDLDPVFLLGGTVPSVAWLPNDGTGQFGFPVFVDPGVELYELMNVTDMDKDGDPDLVIWKPGGRFWYSNDGKGVFSGPVLLSSAEMFWPKVADMDGDTLPDMVYGKSGEGLVWARNSGTGDTLELPRQIFPEPFFTFASTNYGLADLDGNGYTDLLGIFEDYVYGWVPNLGEGKSFGDRVVLGAAYYGTCRGEDVDGDGEKDFLLAGLDRLLYHTGLEQLPTVRGLFFRDDNENGLQDPGETPLPGLTATLSPASVLSVSDGQGAFQFLAEQGAYALGFRPDPCWVLTTDSTLFHFSVPTLPGAVYRFGFRPNLSASKISPFAVPSQPICGQTVPFWLTLRNDGCHPARARLHFFPGNLLTWASASPPPTSVSADEIVWESDTLLQPGQTRLINALIDIAPAVAGDYPIVRAIAETLSPDGLSLIRKDTFEHTFQVFCSFDPNDKSVNVSELPPAYTPDSAELTYTIRFQNTGNFKAFNIRIRDTLDAALDRSTFRPLAASHPYTATLDSAAGTLTFEFRDILLPDSTSNEPESHGFVAFSIRLRPGLAPGERARNRAGIYFDINPPVITNWAETKVRASISTHTPSVSPSLRLAPNPASTMLTLLFQEKTVGPAHVQVFDWQGKMVLENRAPSGVKAFPLDISALSAGAYFVKITEKSGATAQAFFVKI